MSVSDGDEKRVWRPGKTPLKLLAIAMGVALLVIGVRFLVVPERAGQFFGIGRPAGPHDLHYVVALRDLWIAGILIALAVMEEWRALAVAVGLGALVCFGDSVIAFYSSRQVWSVLFHVASGIFCTGLAAACWRRAKLQV